ncbi:MAG: hypothetical protein NT027_03185 [Proteobacteria bacterium]|nr:hypothetical protein [Pseudomonadota bacterium]
MKAIKQFSLPCSTLTILCLGFSSWITGCGLERGSKYDGDKDFGRQTTNQDDGNNDTGLENPPTPSPKPSDGPDVDTTPVEPEDPQDAILGHYGFVADFKKESLLKIVKGEKEAYLTPLSFFERTGLSIAGISKIFDMEGTLESLDIITQEAGTGRSEVTQNAVTQKGDALAEKAGRKESISGKQKLFWKLSSQSTDCPKPFICADRITWTPVKGPSFSYCFRNAADQKSISVPYAPNTQFKPENFEEVLPGDGVKTSAPFIISKHEGIVDCTQEGTVTLDIKAAQWSIEYKRMPQSLPRGFYRKATFNPIVPDSEIKIKYAPYSFEFGRAYLPNDGQFIDTISRFSSSTIYYLNSSEKVFTKIVKTNQMPVELLNIFYGMQIDYEFEFCTHKNTVLVPNPVNHCPTRVRR